MRAANWIFSKKLDLFFLSGPAFFSVLIVFLLQDTAFMNEKISPATWLILIVGIDASHVYSTIFRTYANKQEYAQNKTILLLIPLICFLSGIILYSFGSMIFWRFAAYLALFHFVRQQFGFMAIYRKINSGNSPDIPFIYDKIAIYSFSLLPVFYWHFTEDKREFSWFRQDDFLFYQNQSMADSLLYLLYSIYLLWILATVFHYLKTDFLNWGKIFLMLGTAASWYTGIVYFNSDVAFSMTNVISHGIPYIFLIWFYIKRNNSAGLLNHFGKSFFSLGAAFLVFSFSLFFLAYLEEFLWDIFIWKDHSIVFGEWNAIPQLPEPILKLLVPLLFLPQSTHYVLDAFIWKLNTENKGFYSVLNLDNERSYE